jgi:ribosomal protein S18 acetylase RimI-like enzyme
MRGMDRPVRPDVAAPPIEDLRIDEDPRPEDVALLNDQLYRFNASATGVDDGRWLAIFVRDAAGQIEAGLHGWTWGGTGFVQTLWVREDLRRRGLGSRLLRAAEQEAERRGCVKMELETHNYQAPDFYRRLGYETVGELPGWPGHSTRISFRKALSS